MVAIVIARVRVRVIAIVKKLTDRHDSKYNPCCRQKVGIDSYASAGQLVKLLCLLGLCQGPDKLRSMFSGRPGRTERSRFLWSMAFQICRSLIFAFSCMPNFWSNFELEDDRYGLMLSPNWSKRTAEASRVTDFPLGLQTWFQPWARVTKTRSGLKIQVYPGNFHDAW